MWPWRKQTTKEKGDSLERRVERLYRRLGKLNVKRNVALKDLNGNASQIDVRYGLIWRYANRADHRNISFRNFIYCRKYVECKNYNHPVPLEMVAKFKEVLRLNGISPSRGVFITTNTFTPRATTIGIKTLDGKQLRRLERMAPLILLSKIAFASLCLYTAYRVQNDYQKSRRRSFEEYYIRDLTLQRAPVIFDIPPTWIHSLLEWKHKVLDFLPRK